jgi:predicted transcriptional regulator
MDVAILQALSTKKQLRVTHIMYKSNLNANTLKKKLEGLEAKGLIRAQRVSDRKQTVLYGVTSWGWIFCAVFFRLKMRLWKLSR